jgi:hypothetical protein
MQRENNGKGLGMILREWWAVFVVQDRGEIRGAGVQIVVI